jgi:hypothetical protein
MKFFRERPWLWFFAAFILLLAAWGSLIRVAQVHRQIPVTPEAEEALLNQARMRDVRKAGKGETSE